MDRLDLGKRLVCLEKAAFISLIFTMSLPLHRKYDLDVRYEER